MTVTDWWRSSGAGVWAKDMVAGRAAAITNINSFFIDYSP
jgi:hypothetical protein